MRLKSGAVLSTLVAFLATGGIVAAFVLNASPYMTIEEAKKSTGQKINVVGDIDKQTLVNNALANKINFDLVDEQGHRIPVVYSGPTPSNMGSATRVVAIGHYESGRFNATELRIKCPSKYEAQGSQ